MEGCRPWTRRSSISTTPIPTAPWGVASSWIASRPAVLVVHENRGLNPHIKDVGRRLGVEGFLAFAVDALSPLGGTPADEDKAREMIGTLDRDETLRRIAAAVPFLAAHPESNGKVGAVGFCWGGAMANRLAAAGTSLAASVAYYGMPLPAEEVPKVTAALLLHYAGLDERINAGMAAYEAALKASGKAYEQYVYPGANHAFNNDTNAARYDKAAADLAWGRTIAFLKKRLGGWGSAYRACDSRAAQRCGSPRPRRGSAPTRAMGAGGSSSPRRGTRRAA